MMEKFTEILQFLDGRLDMEKSELLFMELAKNDGLRAEFQRHLEIESSISSNQEYFDPPASSLSNVISSAGVTLTPHPGAFANIANTIKSMSPISSALMSSILTGLTVFGIMLSINKQAENNVIARPVESPIASSYILRTGNIERQHELITAAQTKQVACALNEKPRIVYIRDTVYQTIDAKEPVRKELQIGKDDILLAKENMDFWPGGGQVDFPGTTPVGEVENIIPPTQSYSAWQIETYYSPATHFPNPEVQADYESMFDNLGVGVYYSLSDNFKLGLDLRNETFYQEFEDENKYYWQQPVLTTGTLTGRYSISELGSLRPYGQFAAGFNIAGLVLRPQIGMEFAPLENLNILLGCEYSYLRFKHAEQGFGASKLGLYYGINYKF